MSAIDSKRGYAVLILAHIAGMIDLAALPVWIGTLVRDYGFAPHLAGLTVTLCLASVVVASLVVSPRFDRLHPRGAISGGFALAAAGFAVMAVQPRRRAELPDPGVAALLCRARDGVCAVLRARAGRSQRQPHRLFAVASASFGVLALTFLATIPPLIQRSGGQALFWVLFAILANVSLAVGVSLPNGVVEPGPPLPPSPPLPLPERRVPRPAWVAAGVVVCLTLNQSMVFSFAERIGADRGFGTARVNAALGALGLVNLLPGTLAVLLQRRLSPIAVGIAGPLGQAALAHLIATSKAFPVYAIATCLYPSMVIFTHAYLFGLIARLDRTGHAVAATPAMMMTGSCIGPALAGALVHPAATRSSVGPPPAWR